MSATLESVVGSLNCAVTLLPKGLEVHVHPIVTLRHADYIGVSVEGFSPDGEFRFSRRFVEPQEVETFLMAEGLLRSPRQPIWAIAE